MRIEPPNHTPQTSSDSSQQAAIDLIRAKVAHALGEETLSAAPATADQMSKAVSTPTPSKHQRFMVELQQSNKSLAEVQTEWHRYYTLLPDEEKNEVWQEFYASNSTVKPANTTSASRPQSASITSSEPAPAPFPTKQEDPASKPTNSLSPTAHRPRRGRIKQPKKQESEMRKNIKSILFGLGVGGAVLVVFLFSFFNEYVFAPFFQPSRTVTAAPVIMNENMAATAEPTVIVPKINIQIPVDFEVPSIDEATVQASLEGGVVHYPSTALPGQNGNGAYFGHSSQNVFNNGKYKFAFVLLHQITTGDVFYITYKGKIYAYQVFAREVVPPTQVSVLNDSKGKQATAALITCDPPGFSTNRLVVWGEQISPSIAANTTHEPQEQTQQLTQITSKGPSWWDSLFFWRRNEAAGQ